MATSAESRKRPLEGDDYNSSEIKRSIFGKPVLKFLVQNYVAGKLIGKGGSTLGELQSKYDLSIKISPSKEFYPGTSDRIVCVIGEIENIIEFGNYLIGDTDTDATAVELKLLISNDAAGFVLGKGGAQIQSIKTESKGAKIFLDKKAENLTGERVLKVLGDVTQAAAAFSLIMETVAEAKDRISNTDLKYSTQHNAFNLQPAVNNTPSFGNNTPSFGNNNTSRHGYESAATAPMSNYAMTHGNADYQSKSQFKVKFCAEMEIPDELVGTVLGKGGQRCLEINRSSGARLQFSKKDEFVEGTKNRLLTITGSSSSQVQKAYVMVDEALVTYKANESYNIY